MKQANFSLSLIDCFLLLSLSSLCFPLSPSLPFSSLFSSLSLFFPHSFSSLSLSHCPPPFLFSLFSFPSLPFSLSHSLSSLSPLSFSLSLPPPFVSLFPSLSLSGCPLADKSLRTLMAAHTVELKYVYVFSGFSFGFLQSSPDLQLDLLSLMACVCVCAQVSYPRLRRLRTHHRELRLPSKVPANSTHKHISNRAGCWKSMRRLWQKGMRVESSSVIGLGAGVCDQHCFDFV